MIPYYFDTLPIHPQPKPLESLTSYIIRLAEANAIQSRNQMQTLFLDHPGTGGVRMLVDLPMNTYGPLPVLAGCSEAVLRATTFYYLAENFDRPTSSQGVNQFLDGCLARWLRYCPLCLQSGQPYYSLAWRFLTLPGCPQHGCRFLDCCPQCGQEIAFLPTSLKIGVCPGCGAALSTGRVEPLEPHQHQAAQAHYRDLAFLLAPRPAEMGPVAVGPRLAYWRQIRHLTTEDVARQIGRTVVRVRILERSVLNHGTQFHYYLDYANLLGLTIEEIFNTVLPPEAQIRGQFSREEMRQYREEELVRRTQEAIATLKAQGRPLLQPSVSELVGMSLSTLQAYPRVKAILSGLVEEHSREIQQQRLCREQELALRVEQVIDSLQAEGQRVVRRTIAERMGMTAQALKQYPQVRAILDQVSEAYKQTMRQQKEQRVQEWVADVRQAIAQLKSEGRPVTKKAVAQLIGHSPDTLESHPQLKAILVEGGMKVPQPSQPPEQALLEKARKAVSRLQAQDRPLTETAIKQLTRPRPTTLKRDPQLAWTVEVCDEDKKKRSQQREQAVRDKILETLEQLKSQGQPVSQKDICRRAGLPAGVFQKYPDLRAQVALERQHSKQDRQARQAQDLLQQVEQAVADLRVRGMPLTQLAIAQQVGWSVTTLRNCPQVYARLREVIQERQSERRSRREEREEALVQQVRAAMEQLRSMGMPVTQKAIGRMLSRCLRPMGKYPRVKELLEQVRVEGETEKDKDRA